MSRVFLYLALHKVANEISFDLPEQIVNHTDTLKRDVRQDGYDLIIGNPPYGKVPLSDELRHRFKRSLYGHANLYGLFFDLACSMTHKAGYIAFVTPTSFLSGQYFKNLRKVLFSECSLLSIDFIESRQDVFHDVLQETAITVFKKTVAPQQQIRITNIVTDKDTIASTQLLGAFQCTTGHHGTPLILPRTPRQVRLLEKGKQFTNNFTALGFAVKTGPLVWNRHKDQLREEKTDLGVVSIDMGGVHSKEWPVPVSACKKESPTLY